MKTTTLSRRLALSLLLAVGLLGPAAPTVHAAPPTPHVTEVQTTSLQANRLVDYIRGNRSRMVQVATIGLGIGLLILMTATRKH